MDIVLAFLWHLYSPVSPFKCILTLSIWMTNNNSSGFKRTNLKGHLKEFQISIFFFDIDILKGLEKLQTWTFGRNVTRVPIEGLFFIFFLGDF